MRTTTYLVGLKIKETAYPQANRRQIQTQTTGTCRKPTRACHVVPCVPSPVNQRVNNYSVN